MEAKKRKLSETSPHFECCVCGESGSNGFTNTYNISLREKDDFLISFVEVVSFVLGIEVNQESSDICISCKPKIIEYYHFKKRSQSIQKKLSPLIQEIMKIVNNYITKNNIKAITIEESREKLVLMEKIHPQQPVSQEFNEIIEVKRESGSSVALEVEVSQDSLMEPDIIIKEEIVNELAIKQEPLDIDESLSTHEISLPNNGLVEDLSSTQPNSNVVVENSDLTKLDQILNLNKEIFNVISSLDYKINEMRPSTSKAKSNIVPYKLTNAIRPQRE